MKLLADENLDAEIVAFLRQEGHDVAWMVELAAGTEDGKILEMACTENRVIITFDRDFGELVYYRRQHAPGIVFLRLQPPSPSGLLADFQRLWPRVAASAVGNFIVATKDKIRVRPIMGSTS